MASEWIKGIEARRILGVGDAKLLRMAVLGRVRTLLEPGCTVRYHRADVEKVAAEGGRLQVA